MSRIPAGERVQRILAVLPWIVSNPGCAVDEVCARFEVSREDLITDLDYVFVNVGLHPFTPDMLAEVSIEDDRITVILGDYFRRPLRLTGPEALMLLTAAKAARRFGVHDEGTQSSLETAAEKLAAVLGEESGDALDLDLEIADRETLDILNAAMSAHKSVAIGYYTFGRDDRSQRVVDPFRIVNNNGYWYLTAWCHTASAIREFRVDRIYSATLTEERFTPPAELEDHGLDLSNRTLTVEITGDSIDWVVDKYAYDELETLDDGRLRVVLPVTAEPWLERLVLRLDPEVEVREHSTGRDLRYLATDAARRIISRYQLAPDENDRTKDV